MKGPLRARVFLSGCGVTAISVCAPVLAQAGASGSAPTSAAVLDQTSAVPGEIIVTAQRRSENIQKVPIAVTAIGTQTLRERNIVTLQDLNSVVPALKFGEFSGAGNVSVRGIGSAYVSGAGQSSVAVYTDGVYLSQIQSFITAQYDLGSVEVLEGPQGTLYGRNSTGGVVNFTSNGPTKDLSFGASFLAGNYAEKKEEAYIGGPLSDHVRVRVYGENEDRDGWTLDTETGQKLNGTKNFGGRIAIDADVSSNWKSQLRVSAFKDNFTGPVFDGFYPAFALIPAPFNDFAPYRVNDPVHFSSFRTNIVVSEKNIFQLSPTVSLTSTTGFNRFVNHLLYDSLGNSLLQEPGDSQRQSNAFSQEFDLNGSTSRLKWVAGTYLYYHRNHFHILADETNLFGLAPPGGAHITVGPQATSVLDVNDSLGHEYSASVFGDATYTVFDRTRLYGGARLTYDRVKEGLTQGLGILAPPVDACTATADPERVTKTSVTGRVGIQQDLTSTAMAYGQYSHGFKAPGFSESDCFNAYKPETIDAFEVGFKSQWFDKRLTFNADAFHYQFKNQQIEIVNATSTGLPVFNVPKSHIWGAEATLVAQLLPDIRLDGGLVLLHAVYDEFTNQDPVNGAPLGLSLNGNQLDNAPNAAGTIGLEYRHSFAGVGKFTLRGEASLTASYHLRELNEPYTIQRGFVMANAYATYTTPDGHYYIRAFGKNLNKVVVLGGELGFGGALGAFGPPRTYGAAVGVNF